MRSLAFGIGFWLVSVASAASHDGPFYPTTDVPDHVVTLVERHTRARESVARMVYSHGDWTRVDVKTGGGTSSHFWQRDCKVNVQLFRYKDESRSLTIQRGCQESAVYDHNAINTGEQQRVADERCTVWSTRRSKPSAHFKLDYTSCITDDGIELWYKAVGGRGDVISSAEATSVERRPVTPAEAYPPADLLEVDGWFIEAENPRESNQADFEIVMQRESGSVSTRTERRRGHWTYEDERSNSVLKRVSVHNTTRGLSFTVHDIDGDKPVLRLSTRSQAGLAQIEPAAPLWFTQPRPLGRHETVLGEHCEWFETTQMDVSHSTCRASDGIALKNLWVLRGQERVTEVAIRLTRRPVTLREMMPPADLLDPKTWGLPD
jgi:hypothetical protein